MFRYLSCGSGVRTSPDRPTLYFYIMNTIEIGIHLAALVNILETFEGEIPPETMARVSAALIKNPPGVHEDVSAEQVLDQILTNLGV